VRLQPEFNGIWKIFISWTFGIKYWHCWSWCVSWMYRYPNPVSQHGVRAVCNSDVCSSQSRWNSRAGRCDL